MARKLDMLDGEMNGIPRLPPSIDRSLGIDALSAARTELVIRIVSGDCTMIDPYAAENPGELFAVASEIHSSAPALLQVTSPRVADLLGRYFWGEQAVVR